MCSPGQGNVPRELSTQGQIPSVLQAARLPLPACGLSSKVLYGLDVGLPGLVGSWLVAHCPGMAWSPNPGLQVLQERAQGRWSRASSGQGACRLGFPVPRSHQRPQAHSLSLSTEMGFRPWGTRCCLVTPSSHHTLGVGW